MFGLIIIVQYYLIHFLLFVFEYLPSFEYLSTFVNIMSLFNVRQYDYSSIIMNNSDSQSSLPHLVQDPLRRIWLYYSLKDEIKQTYDVEMEITGKGFQFYGRENKIYDAIQKVSQYGKTKIIKPFQTDHEWKKLEKLHNKLQRIDIGKIQEICQSLKIDLNVEWEYLLIFDKNTENEMKNILEDANVKTFDLTTQQAIRVKCTKCIKQIQEKTGCQINLTNNSIGGQSSVQEAEKNVRTILKKYIWLLLLSDKQDPKNGLKIPIVGEILKQKGYKIISNQKLELICKGHQQLQKYFQQYVGKYQRFLAVLVKNTEIDKVKGQLKEFQKNKNQQKQQSNRPTWHNSQPQSNSHTEYNKKPYNSKVKKTKEQQKYQIEFPIDKYVYQGIQKFSNFKKKLTLMQNHYLVEITPEYTQRQDGSYYYSLKFIESKNNHVIQQELQFFFNDYKCKEYTAPMNGIVNLAKLQRFIQKIVKECQEFKELIVDDVAIKNGFLKFKAYSAKKDTRSIIDDLQKYIITQIKQQIKLIEKK